MQKIYATLENPNGVLVDMTPEEVSQRETDEANANAEKEALAIKEQAEATAKYQKEIDALAGNNKLLALGLTQAEATALTGYTPPTEV